MRPRRKPRAVVPGERFGANSIAWSDACLSRKRSCASRVGLRRCLASPSRLRLANRAETRSVAGLPDWRRAAGSRRERPLDPGTIKSRSASRECATRLMNGFLHWVPGLPYKSLSK
jgi:hypothetical protein